MHMRHFATVVLKSAFEKIVYVCVFEHVKMQQDKHIKEMFKH